MKTSHVRDITGHRNGRLVAVECTGRNYEGRAMWRCQCDCGNQRTVQSNNLLRDAGTKSCGCLRVDANLARLKRDGAWNEGKSYSSNAGMRCYKSRASWSKAVIKAKGNMCESCGWDRARCDVHHKIPKSDGGLNTIENGVVLCPNCHRLEHEAGVRK